MSLAVPIKTAPVDLLLAREEDVAGIRLRRDPSHTRVRVGVYAASSAWQALEPWERYLGRVHAYALLHPGAVFSAESAAALLGLPVFGEPRDIHVFDAERTRSFRVGDVSVHTSQDPREVVEAGPLAVTSVRDTAVDLARVLPPAFALAVVDAAIGHESSPPSLRDLVDRSRAQSSSRGRRKLEWVWERADVRAESPGESVSRAVLEWWGFERPELQVEFRADGTVDRTDFFWRARRVIGESDGYGKYRADDPEETRRHLVEEKRREDRLRRVARGFARWDWRDTMRAVPLRDKLIAATLPQVRHPQAAMLATLRTHPRSFSAAELSARATGAR